jgi:hypothetical protein
MRRLLAATVVAVLLTGGVAHAVGFGANLRRPANNPTSCQGLIFYQQVPSCSFSTTGSQTSTAESLLVPGNGRINRVRIKVGAQTGPMRVTVAQALRREDAGEAACCTGRRQSRVLRPRRNRTTTFDVNLPVRSTFNSQSRYYAYDILFLTMENPNTPIPASLSDPNDPSSNCSGGWFPAIRPGQENFSGPYGVCGATILLRANWVRRR